ncbi:MAG: hypothetical protein OXI63_01590 [Candidatus Poribacteria bacterium]|nr:hypothetical protein [Candidatus Poribacteria bacterium]
MEKITRACLLRMEEVKENRSVCGESRTHGLEGVVEGRSSTTTLQKTIDGVGLILFIYIYEHLDAAIDVINKKPKPLALYVFGNNRRKIDKIRHQTSSEGGTINDLLMHVNAKEMGFGEVGYSGMGRYKGGFITLPIRPPSERQWWRWSWGL